MGFGVILSPPDPRDYLIKQIAPIEEYPSTIRLDDKYSVRNQYFCGTCVGKASASLLSAGHEIDLSSLYIYARCKELDGYPSSEGTFPRIALKVMQKEGSCRDITLPYSELKACTVMPKITNVMTTEAADFKIGSYARLYYQTDIKRALVNGHYVMAVILIADNFMNYKDGIIGKPTGNVYGYHAVVICGYDDTKQAFRGVNSWGKSWGEEGYFWLDYDYMTQMIWFPEAWSAVIKKITERVNPWVIYRYLHILKRKLWL
jgi:C1A family cysteine protease